MDSRSFPAPLKDLVVVDLGQVLATPFATHLLHSLGAEVIKVEPPGGDWLRSTPNLSFATQNAGKQSVVVDMRVDGGAEVVLRLAERADVFVEGFAPGVADRMGVGWDDVAARNPGIVYGSLSAFGADGPYGGRPGFDHVVQAVSGTMWSSGFEDGPPVKVGAPYLDYGSGLLLAFGLLAGLLEQRRTGTAVRVDTTMLDTGLLLNAAAVVNTHATGRNPRRTGNNAFSGAVASGAFETADGWLMLAANKEAHLRRLEELLEIEPLPGDVDAARLILAAHFAEAGADHWERLLNEHRIPAAKVRWLSDVVDDGYSTDRGLLQPVELPDHDDPVLIPTAGVRFDGVLPGPDGPPPVLGHHTDAVLTRFGFAADEITRLRRAGVLGGTD